MCDTATRAPPPHFLTESADIKEQPPLMYECGDCGKSFQSTWWLSQHQNQCEAHKSLLDVGGQEFQKVHGTPEKTCHLLSKFDSLFFGHGRTESSREQSAGVSDLTTSQN